MTRMSADERRERLLEAAERVMRRDGVAAGTTRAIAAEAGMAVSVFHYCFRSRDELVGELIRRLGTAEQQAIWRGIEPSHDLRAVLTSALDAYLDHLEANPGLEQMLFELNHYALRTPGMEHLAAGQVAMYVTSARGVLELVTELTGVTWRVPLDEVARLVVTIIDGATTTWLGDRDTAATRRALEHLMGLLVSLAVPVAEPVPRP